MENPTTEEGLSPKLAQLRAKLGLKAQAEPNFKFYTLNSLVLRMDVLEAAWKLVRKNKGAAGYDGRTIESIQGQGVEAFLQEIQGKSS